MYYLIKDKIINDQKDEFALHCKQKAETDEDYNVPIEEIIECHLGDILKKSENLYDLIEEGDLIAFDYMNTGVIDIEKVVFIYKHRDGEVDISTRGYLHNNEKIQAIYKPNSKGDYIKVWEREE